MIPAWDSKTKLYKDRFSLISSDLISSASIVHLHHIVIEILGEYSAAQTPEFIACREHITFAVVFSQAGSEWAMLSTSLDEWMLRCLATKQPMK